MDYTTYIRRSLISFLTCASIAIWFLYLYFELWDFIRAAISLKYVNIQTVSFSIYSFFLVLLPSAIVYSPRHSKKNLFKAICFGISASLLLGTIGDIITYNFFKDYTFLEGDAIFCNIVVSIPNMYGVLCCLILSFAYALFGIYLTENRIASFFLYLLIFLIIATPPFIYSFSTWGGFPRQTWVQKAAFIIPYHACLLLSLLLASTSKFIWREHIR